VGPKETKEDERKIREHVLAGSRWFLVAGNSTVPCDSPGGHFLVSFVSFG
jgi:hypothetical protein